MEDCHLFVLDIKSSEMMVNMGMENAFIDRVEFLWSIDLFEGINKNIMLPLAANLTVNRYSKGDFV